MTIAPSFFLPKIGLPGWARGLVALVVAAFWENREMSAAETAAVTVMALVAAVAACLQVV